jgi:hypothetical protein
MKNIKIKGLDENDLGKDSLEQLNRIEQGNYAKESGQLGRASKKGGNTTGKQHYENGTGLFGMSKTKKRKAQTNGGKVAGKLAVKKGTVVKAGKVSAKSSKHPNNTLIKCKHCSMVSTLPTISRWHNDNCKLKKSKK